MPEPVETSPYEESKDESLFRELIVIHGEKLDRLEVTEGVVTGMAKVYRGLDWSA